jgi:hypothetical protein
MNNMEKLKFALFIILVAISMWCGISFLFWIVGIFISEIYLPLAGLIGGIICGILAIGMWKKNPHIERMLKKLVEDEEEE